MTTGWKINTKKQINKINKVLIITMRPVVVNKAAQ